MKINSTLSTLFKAGFLLVFFFISKVVFAQSCDPKWNRTKSSNFENSDVYFEANSPGRVTFKWDFGDGSNSTQMNPVHKYSKAGNYVILFEAFDASGNKCSDTIQLSIMQAPAAIFEVALNKNDLVIFPNPAYDKIFIKGILKGELLIFDLNGKEVLRTEINKDQSIDISRLKRGTYFVKCSDGSFNYNGRFVKVL